MATALLGGLSITTTSGCHGAPGPMRAPLRSRNAKASSSYNPWCFIPSWPLNPAQPWQMSPPLNSLQILS